MKYLNGPIQSRRLGLSLGVSLTPYKTCSFDCIYCQLGRTKYITIETKEYVPGQEILNELKNWYQANPQEAKGLSYITFSGAGEPMLNSKAGNLISRIKEVIPVPVAVITNTSLLNTPELRQALLGADLIVPSLDAVTEAVFQRINRPHPKSKLEDIINGLISLRKEFKGRIWLEVMLVKGVNDDLGHIRKLRAVIEKINPDKIHLNSPVRVTADPDVTAVDRDKLEKIREMLGDKCEII